MSEENTPITQPETVPTKRQRAKAHLKKHSTKYSTGAIIAGLVGLLQLFGALAPIICHLPWVKDPAACMEQGVRAEEAAHKLDGLRLDAVVPDGGLL